MNFSLKMFMLVLVTLMTYGSSAQLNDAFDIETKVDLDNLDGILVDAISEGEPLKLRVDEGNEEDENNDENNGTIKMRFDFDFDVDQLKKLLDEGEEVEEHEFDATPMEDQDEILKLERNAKPVILDDNDSTTNGRELSSCVSFEDVNKNPGSAITEIHSPWAPIQRKTCKIYMRWSDGSSGVCSASLIGPNHIITAAHCTLDGCGNGFATQILVKCGYGYKSGTSDYAQLGTAYVTRCSHYKNYVDDLTCVNGRSRGPFKWDIQVCQIDRTLLHSHGHFGTTTATYSSTNVRGYPGDPDLNSYVSQATHKQFWRYNSASAISSKQYRLNGAWAFGGESGGPYYAYVPSKGRYVNAVHNGGPTSCYELGRRVDGSFINIIKDKLKNWVSTSYWCNVIEDRVNVNGVHSAPYKGLSLSFAGPYTSYVSTFHGSTFLSKFPLINVGTKPTGSFKVYYYAERAGETKYLGYTTTHLNGWTTKMIYRGFNTGSLTAGKSYKIVAKWWPVCKTSSDPKEASIGWLYVKKLPYGRYCTNDNVCSSGNCHNNRCCHPSENTKFCDACSATTGMCSSCLPYHLYPGCSNCLSSAYKQMFTGKCIPKLSIGQACNAITQGYGDSQCLSGYCKKISPTSTKGYCALKFTVPGKLPITLEKSELLSKELTSECLFDESCENNMVCLRNECTCPIGYKKAEEEDKCVEEE